MANEWNVAWVNGTRNRNHFQEFLHFYQSLFDQGRALLSKATILQFYPTNLQLQGASTRLARRTLTQLAVHCLAPVHKWAEHGALAIFFQRRWCRMRSMQLCLQAKHTSWMGQDVPCHLPAAHMSCICACVSLSDLPQAPRNHVKNVAVLTCSHGILRLNQSWRTTWYCLLRAGISSTPAKAGAYFGSQSPLILVLYPI